MFKKLATWFTPQYEIDLPLEYATVYGPHLRKNANTVSESFYDYISKKACAYVTPSSKVLDAGCGLGRLTIDVANKGAKDVIGIDTNASLIFESDAIAHNHRRNLLTYPLQKNNCTFLTADIQALPFQASDFSLALCINVVDRISDPHKALDELYRVLKPHGILLLCDPYHWIDRVTPPAQQVSDLKDLLRPQAWQILFEKDPLPFALQITPRRTLHYKNHLLILKKK